ncbi:MAG: sulfatase-like hydrolase/transferase, partial [Pirellulales bacterium]|nr:sulfatase-like hydrolase/transferase [Pirellulales bacterium]
ESLRGDCIGTLHQGIEITPSINQLAAAGIRFANAYSQSTHSNYADPCIASSQYPLRGRLPRPYRRNDPFPKTLIYDLLKPRGYATAIISSQNEAWFSMDQFYESPNLDLLFDPQRVEGKTYVDVRDWGMAREALGGTLRGGKFIDSYTADHAIDWIAKQASRETPFFLQMNLQSSHFPYPLPPQVPRPFQPCEIDFPASFVGYRREKTDVVRNAYFNAIAECDRQIGRIVAALHRTDQFQNTVLVVVGENGESFYEDGTVTHGGPPSQVQLKVAWVMTAPGLDDPSVEDYPVELVDVVPTVLGRLGLPRDPNHQGIDVLSSQRPALKERLLFFHVNSPHGHAVATIWGGRWKFIAFEPGTWSHVQDPTGRGEALFDLANDAEESENLVLEQPEISALLRDVLERWRGRQLAYYNYPQFYLKYAPPRPPKLMRSGSRE